MIPPLAPLAPLFTHPSTFISRVTQQSLHVHSRKSSFFTQKSPKSHFFCTFSPKNLQNPKCSSYLCTVFQKGERFPAKFHPGGHWTSCGRALHGLRTPRQQMHHRNSRRIPQASSLSAWGVSAKFLSRKTLTNPLLLTRVIVSVKVPL